MRPILVLGFLATLSIAAHSQSPQDQALLEKTRALYDAPFRRDLASFNCSVTFDWKAHFIDLLGSVPPAATALVDRLQTIHYRVAVDRNQAVVSSIPSTPTLSDVQHATELEQSLRSIIASGMNSWIPVATNVILPVGPTNYTYQNLNSEYKLTMTGAGVDGKLLLTPDLRVTSGVIALPQPFRFASEFTQGSDGLVLSYLQTANTTDMSAPLGASFRYTYQRIEGFQLPLRIEITAELPEKWHYTLSDCKVSKSITIKNLPRS